MQNDREKLIELIKEAYCPVMGGFGDEEKVKWLSELDIVYNWEEVADHLIANGVVIQKQGEWVEVDRRSGHGVCSNCNRLDGIDPLATHCRYCGAKMKEVK